MAKLSPMPGKKTGRTNKPGAGRPRINAEPTVPIRVPKSLGPFVADRANWDAIAKLKDAKDRGE